MNHTPAWKVKSRELARDLFWGHYDRSHYHCPDCGRKEDETYRGFEVHHINGDPRDNRVRNLVGLCRVCHMLREGKKPSENAIKTLRDSVRSGRGDIYTKERRPNRKDAIQWGLLGRSRKASSLSKEDIAAFFEESGGEDEYDNIWEEMKSWGDGYDPDEDDRDVWEELKSWGDDDGAPATDADDDVGDGGESGDVFDELKNDW